MDAVCSMPLTLIWVCTAATVRRIFASFFELHSFADSPILTDLRKKSSENIHYLHKAIDYLQRRLKIDGFLEEKFWAAYVVRIEISIFSYSYLFYSSSV
jgi:hypothetical protein